MAVEQQITKDKKCTKCKTVKPLSEFGKRKTIKSGFISICKKCGNEYLRSNRKKSEKYKQWVKEYQKSSKFKSYRVSSQWKEYSKNYLREYNKLYGKTEKAKAYKKQYKKSEKYKKQQREYRKRYYERTGRERSMTEERKSRQKEYRQTERAKATRKNYHEKKYGKDIKFTLATLIRKRMNTALKRNYKSGSAVRDLGCSVEELKIHLEKQFQEGMTWDNHGRIDRKNPKVWNIDHIKPLSKFDLTNREQFLQAVHYTNLQPLWAHDNISKGNR